MQRKSEARFWRLCAWLLGAVLAISVVANSVQDQVVPAQITLLAFGILVALGVGNSIVNSATSPVVLSKEDEARFRKNQYAVGLVISTVLAALLLFTPLGGSTLTWLFMPIIFLPYVLIIRAQIVK